LGYRKLGITLGLGERVEVALVGGGHGGDAVARFAAEFRGHPVADDQERSHGFGGGAGLGDHDREGLLGIPSNPGRRR